MFSSGLVLEGGGLRAAYESGVTDAFIENNITFPYVIGVSAGSCNGVSFIAKNLHRMRDIMVNYAHDERYMGIKSIFKSIFLFPPSLMFFITVLVKNFTYSHRKNNTRTRNTRRQSNIQS